MLLTLQSNLKRAIAAGAEVLFDLEIDDPVLEIPKDLNHGDLATPVVFDLAKRIKAATGEKRNPRELATALRDWLQSADKAIAGISRIEIAGAGYINFFLDRAALLAPRIGEQETLSAAVQKIIVEHTSVNPNKAAHIGHLRNAVLGDSIVQVLRGTGRTVEVQNYIDNTGVQVADVVVGFLHIDKMSLDEVREIPEPFDYYCWDLYSKVGLFYRDGDPNAKESPARLALRTEVQHEVESGTGPIAEMADYVATRNLAALLRTMLRLGIVYDVLPRESEVLQSNFWSDAFEMLKDAGAIHFVAEGNHAGCWVMRADAEAAEATGDAEDATESDDDFAADKILVKSNGLVTYAGKDIAYHLWKLNRIDRDFNYERFFEYPDGHVAWITTPEPVAGARTRPRFGHGDRYINVIDVGQSYVQDFVKKGVMAVADDPGIAESTHLDYEKVGLTVAACEDLGYELSDEELGKTFIGMSGRKGRGVKADDLINLLESKALDEVRKRIEQRNYGEVEQHDIAHKIAIGAVRYYLLKFTRNSVIAFDFEDALSFDGETGPYIQYAVVRLNSIFAKLDEVGISTENVLGGLGREALTEIMSRDENQDFWPLLYLSAQLPEVLERAAEALEPAFVAKYAFQLAKSVNDFYHRFRVKDEVDEDRRSVMIAILESAHASLVRALGALGIEAPRRM